MKREVRYFAQDGEEYFLSDCSKYQTVVTSVKLVVFKWEKLFDILTEVPAEYRD